MTRSDLPRLISESAAIDYILRHARSRDINEITATVTYDLDLVARLYEQAPFKKIFRAKDGEPVAFAMFTPLTPVALSASFIATDRWREVALDFMFWGLKFFKPAALGGGFKRLECRTIAGHADAIEMLTRLGFKHEAEIRDYGRNGEVFHQYAWCLSDDVHIPENAGAPEGPTHSAA
jgi:hypothetical protein